MATRFEDASGIKAEALLRMKAAYAIAQIEQVGRPFKGADFQNIN